MNRVKQVLPFLFPIAAILLVVILAFRWYNLRSEQMGQISEFAEGVEIENLSEQELNDDFSGAEDLESIDLSSETEDALGGVRYEIEEGRVRFSVNAALPEPENGFYQVWLKDPAGEAVRKAFRLEMEKGGYSGSAAISAETLPFEIVVSRETNDDLQMEEVVLRGLIEEEAEN